jgi:hypothetical protein
LCQFRDVVLDKGAACGVEQDRKAVWVLERNELRFSGVELDVQDPVDLNRLLCAGRPIDALAKLRGQN